MTHKRTAAVVVVVLGFLVFAGCGDDDDAATPTTASAGSDEAATTGSADGDEGGGASVSVELGETFVEPDPTSAEAGSVEFVAENVGIDVHELVIVKGDDPAALPVDEDGAVIEEDLPEGDFIGEIPLLGPGTEESASFDLDPGSYILFCNIVALPFSHFQDGMVNTLTVT